MNSIRACFREVPHHCIVSILVHEKKKLGGRVQANCRLCWLLCKIDTSSNVEHTRKAIREICLSITLNILPDNHERYSSSFVILPAAFAARSDTRITQPDCLLR